MEKLEHKFPKCALKILWDSSCDKDCDGYSKPCKDYIPSDSDLVTPLNVRDRYYALRNK